ncbi:hydrogenase maturation protease [Frankia sp. AiPs1]|uniref:hydrogenase maturation protease n=1 Tax=Frankia sp. AiPs1 TaxID=573493 RepID=UPI002043293F|nr:hydrogenase maturation protease [Frankia sp. AiPs1]MCM3922422.1 hydrogenase maturation protease [Frankia sp. AiPs1]
MSAARARRRPRPARTLVAGVGNIFLGDDGFGVEVVRRLDPASLPGGVDVADYGIRGLHLAFALLDGRYDTVILVDALASDEPPGTLTVLRPELGNAPQADAPAAVDAPGVMDALAVVDAPVVVDAHGMSPEIVLRLVRDLGGEVGQVVVVGCRPAVVAERMELSGAVRAAVDDAVDLIGDILRDPRLVGAGHGT